MWQKARLTDHPYLYVIKPDYDGDTLFYICSDNPTDNFGDNFAPDDLTPYMESPKIGDTVWVNNVPGETPVPRIFIISANKDTNICVAKGDEAKFEQGERFTAVTWTCMRPDPSKPTEINVQLNELVTARVTKDTITIKGECFPLNALDKLSEAAKKINNDNKC
jgi:hypothetical protein